MDLTLSAVEAITFEGGLLLLDNYRQRLLYIARARHLFGFLGPPVEASTKLLKPSSGILGSGRLLPSGMLPALSTTGDPKD